MNEYNYSPMTHLFMIDRVRTASKDMLTRHYHDAYEIYYLLYGERNYFIKNRIYAVKKGMLVFININELHRTTSANACEYERILINFKPDFLSGLISSGSIDLLSFFKSDNHVIRPNISEQVYLENLLCQMIHEEKKKNYGYELYLKIMLSELLLFINRYKLLNPQDTIDESDTLHEKISEIAGYIHDNYTQTLTLKHLSNYFHLSPCYLSRIFKRAAGFTFIEYLNNIRIMESRRLLKETPLNITQIAEKVGYESITHFGRVFKEVSGVSPLQYRKTTITLCE